MLNERCGACRFFRPKDSERGLCHLLPPSPLHPIVAIDDWCGKFQPKNRPMTRDDSGNVQRRGPKDLGER